MKVKGPIVDPNPTKPVGELDVVTFRKTDLSREMIKGDVGTVMEGDDRHPGFFEVVVNNSTVQTLHRSEFRLATPEDIARMKEAFQKMEDRAKKNGSDMGYKFRISQFPGDPKISGVSRNSLSSPRDLWFCSKMPPRHSLTDAQWRRISPLMPKCKAGRPSTIGDRAFIDAVVWRAKTGCAWRDLHPRFGPWKSIYNRYRDWSQKGLWPDLLRKVHKHGQHAHSIIDSTIVRAHQHSSGGRGGVKKTLSVAQKEESRRRSMLLSILAEILVEIPFPAAIDTTPSAKICFCSGAPGRA